MSVYSHSRLSCFEQCPYKYKLKYIDKVDIEISESIEAFLGSRVHETLEKLYQDLEFQKMNSLEDLLEFLHEQWEEHWHDDIIIVRSEYAPDQYLKMAEKFIRDYYQTYHPFNQGRTLGIEEHIIIDLDGTGKYKLQGYIDRVMETQEGYYEIHDYKTNARLPYPEDIAKDRQLALYAIGVKNRFPDVKDVKLVWHFLAFNKEIDSHRSKEELDVLKQQTIHLIQKIESETTFSTHPSMLCNWCEYKPICKEWSHLFKIQEHPEHAYEQDSGAALVDRYAALKQKQKQLTLDVYAELERVEEALIAYAERKGITVVFGTNNKIRIKTQIRLKYPEKHSSKRMELIEELKKSGVWEQVVQLDTNALTRLINEHVWDEKTISILKAFLSFETSKRLYLSKRND